MSGCARNAMCPCGSGKKYKNCCWGKSDDEKIKLYDEIKNQYAMGQDLLEKKQYNRARKIFEKLVDNQTSSEVASEACLSLAAILSDAADGSAEKYLNRAIALDPENDNAYGCLIGRHFQFGRIKEATDLLNLCTNEHQLDSVAENIIYLFSRISNYVTGKLKFLDGQIEFTYDEDKIIFVEQIIKKLPVGSNEESNERMVLEYAHARLLKYGDEKHIIKSYDMLSRMVDKGYDALFELYVLTELVSVCGPDCLNRFFEGERYALQALRLFDSLKGNSPHELKKFKLVLETNLAILYYKQGKNHEALVLYEKLLAMHPNNTNLHGYARVLSILGRHGESIEYCKRALMIAEDETTLMLLADNYHEIGNNTLAAETYKLALAFMQRGNQRIQYVDGGNTVHSFMNDRFREESCRHVFDQLVGSYCLLGEYVKAKAFSTMALELYPDMQSIRTLEHVIDNMIDSKNATEELRVQLQRVMDDFENERLKASERAAVVKKWAEKLIEIQKVDIGNSDPDLSVEENWQKFSEQIESIISLMKKEEINDNNKLREIKGGLKKKFPRLEKTSIEFLSTAQYLFDKHRNQCMDYAPIMVEYCKVLELELTTIISRTLSIRRELHLYEMIDYLHMNNIGRLGNITSSLHEIRTLRNGSAHCGYSTEERVEKVRSMLFDGGILEKIDHAKTF